MESVKKKRRNQSSNRLTLTPKVLKKAEKWLLQVEDEFNGMLSIKRNDLLNTLLEELEDKLSSKLLQRVKNEKLTDLERAKWVYKKLLNAEKNGLDANFNELMRTAQSQAKRGRKPQRSKKEKFKPEKDLKESTIDQPSH